MGPSDFNPAVNPATAAAIPPAASQPRGYPPRLSVISPVWASTQSRRTPASLGHLGWQHLAIPSPKRESGKQKAKSWASPTSSSSSSSGLPHRRPRMADSAPLALAGGSGTDENIILGIRKYTEVYGGILGPAPERSNTAASAPKSCSGNATHGLRLNSGGQDLALPVAKRESGKEMVKKW